MSVRAVSASRYPRSIGKPIFQAKTFLSHLVCAIGLVYSAGVSGFGLPAQLDIPSSLALVVFDGEPLEVRDDVYARAAQAERHSVVDLVARAGASGEPGRGARLEALKLSANGVGSVAGFGGRARRRRND